MAVLLFITNDAELLVLETAPDQLPQMKPRLLLAVRVTAALAG